ncbi:hypothetical protein SNEBB_000191 [Seison nebaliae]|nr:hypothetical protein SNEBB_000191 [Seison nebaliae]
MYKKQKLSFVDLAFQSRLTKFAIVTMMSGSIIALYLKNKAKDRFTQMPYYIESFRLFKQYPYTKSIFGDNVRALPMNLSDKTNYCDHKIAKINVPVKGSRQKGSLHIHALCETERNQTDERNKNDKINWVIQELHVSADNMKEPFLFYQKKKKKEKDEEENEVKGDE